MKKPTVLVADDDRTLSTLLNRRLRGLGFNVVLAADAMQAWMLTLRVDPAVVVLDLGLPGGSGMDVLERIKTSHKTNMLPVVVLTGSKDPDREEKAVDLGADGFFDKTEDLEPFIEAVCDLANHPYEAAPTEG